MSESQAAPKQVIRHVAALDLRKTAAATLANVKSIENVATVLVSPETAPQLTHVNLSNVASMIEAPANSKITTGQTTLTPTSLAQAPMSAVIIGQLFVESTVTVEEIERGVESLVIAGQVFCPEHLAGIMHSKISHMSGQFTTYPTDGKLVLGKVTLTETYLRQLPDKTNLVVMGKLIATQPLSPELIEQKLGKLYIQGKVIIAEENSAILGKLQEQSDMGGATIIPVGYDFVERPLTLDGELLETFAARSLFCTSLVQFEADVTPEVLTSAIDKLVVKDLLLAPGHLRKSLAQRCDLLNTRAIFYTDKLWFVDGDATLDQAWFDALEGQATLVVTGELELDPALDARILSTRLSGVHNLGEISGTAAQLATLQAHAATNEGEWSESARPMPQDEDVVVVGNIAYLQL